MPPAARGNAVRLPATLATLPAHGGQPLAPAVRQKMEAAFETSFADVRVHVGQHAAALGALAFTHGSNLYSLPRSTTHPLDPHSNSSFTSSRTSCNSAAAARVIRSDRA
jgi:hypothetical protein